MCTLNCQPWTLNPTSLIVSVLLGIHFALRSRQNVACQTTTTACRSSQSQREASGCPPKKGVFVSTILDKHVFPGRYVTADEWEQTRKEKAIVLQKYARRWGARREAQRRRETRDLLLQQEQQQNDRKLWETEVRKRRQERRGGSPVTPADFALLFAEVEAWRRIESKKIQVKGPPGRQRGPLLLLLQQETQLLQRIGRLKQQAEKERKKQQQQRLLEKMGAPLIWVQSDGETATVHTPETIRARELQPLYLRLSAEAHKVPERLATLAAAREAVGAHKGPLADEIRELLHREETLLKRGRCNPLFLCGLRQRINTEFFRLLLDPIFNPQAKLVTKTAIV